MFITIEKAIWFINLFMNNNISVSRMIDVHIIIQFIITILQVFVHFSTSHSFVLHFVPLIGPLQDSIEFQQCQQCKDQGCSNVRTCWYIINSLSMFYNIFRMGGRLLVGVNCCKNISLLGRIRGNKEFYGRGLKGWRRGLVG